MLPIPKIVLDRFRTVAAAAPSVKLTTTHDGLFTVTLKGAGEVNIQWESGGAWYPFTLTAGGVACTHTYGDASEKEITIVGDLSGITSWSSPLMPITSDISFISPLVNLTYLYLFITGVTGDIAVLAGMPLTYLNLGNTGVTGDIAVLAGMPLTTLNLSTTGVTGDIAVLAGMPLAYLNLGNTGVTGDIAVLAGMPLTYLYLFITGVTGDIAVLAGMPLTYLYLFITGVTGDIAVLAGMPLTTLNLSITGVTGDIAVLAGMPLTTLDLGITGVTGDIAVLAGMPLTTLNLSTTGVGCASTVPALSGCTIRLYSCNWTTAEVDNYLAQAVIAGQANNSINIAGTNAPRSVPGSDADLAALLAAGNAPVTVNEP